MTEYWHRIEFLHFAAPLGEFGEPIGEGSIELIHHKFPVVKKTPKGVRLNLGFGLRTVLFDSKRQYASPTFEQAKDKFQKRKKRQIEHLQAQIKSIERALTKLDTFHEQLN
jgi:hypothetical protein